MTSDQSIYLMERAQYIVNRKLCNYDSHPSNWKAVRELLTWFIKEVDSIVEVYNMENTKK